MMTEKQLSQLIHDEELRLPHFALLISSYVNRFITGLFLLCNIVVLLHYHLCVHAVQLHGKSVFLKKLH
jgi:hypothetical protein